MTEGVAEPDFEPAFICAVDVADRRLLGPSLEALADRADLCIDHHGSNIQYARHLLLDASCAATAIMIYHVIRIMGAPVDRRPPNASTPASPPTRAASSMPTPPRRPTVSPPS